MSIFITGASGFIGGAIGKKLSNHNTVFGMARSETSSKIIKASGINPVQCELGQVHVEDLHDSEIVIHCAAFVEPWGTRQQFWDTNVRGTQQLIEIAKKAKIKKFIFISTEACLFKGQNLINIDENYPYPNKTPYLYSLTKREAEKIVINRAIKQTNSKRLYCDQD